jgi:hypothetical protein
VRSSRLDFLPDNWRGPVASLSGALPLIYAAAVTLHAFLRTRHRGLDPDAVAYLRLARDMTVTNALFGPKEPLWATMLMPPVKLAGAHPAIIRLLGMAGFVVMIVGFQRLVSLLYGRTWGIVAALALATSPWLIFQSTRGLREETSAGLVLLFAAAVIRRVDERRLVLLAAAAAGMALLRWDTVLLTVPTLVIATIITRPRLRGAVVAVVAFTALVAPMLLAAKLRYGDPLYFSNTRGAVFFRNLEFGGRPGFPTRAQLRLHAYSGQPITWWDYFFHLHTPEETIHRTLRGGVTIPVNAAYCGFSRGCQANPGRWPIVALAPSPPTLLPWVIAAAGLAGAALLLRRHGTWPLALMLVTSILTFAPIAALMDPRLAIPTLLLLALGLIESMRTVVGWRRRHGPATAGARHPPGPPEAIAARLPYPPTGRRARRPVA